MALWAVRFARITVIQAAVGIKVFLQSIHYEGYIDYLGRYLPYTWYVARQACPNQCQAGLGVGFVLRAATWAAVGKGRNEGQCSLVFY